MLAQICCKPNGSQFSYTYSKFSNILFRADVHKMLVSIANRKDQKQSDLGLHCLSKPFWQAIGVQNFRTFVLTILLKFEYFGTFTVSI